MFTKLFKLFITKAAIEICDLKFYSDLKSKNFEFFYFFKQI